MILNTIFIPLTNYHSNKPISCAGGKWVNKGVKLDMKKYMGRWYEIASLPTFSQPRNGEDTRANYTLQEDGSIHVLNETWSDGKRCFIEGIAYKAAANDDNKLKVKFNLPPFLPIFPIVGDSCVLFVDNKYQVALIGQPTRKCLWILSRKAHIDEKMYNQLVEKARNEGYDVTKLQKTHQSRTPPQADSTPQDTKGLWWIKSLLGT